MEFVFVESLVRNEVKFWNYSRRFMGKGFYLMLVRLALGLVFLVLLGIAALPLIPSILKRPSDFAWPALLGGIFWIIGVIIVLDPAWSYNKFIFKPCNSPFHLPEYRNSFGFQACLCEFQEKLAASSGLLVYQVSSRNRDSYTYSDSFLVVLLVSRDWFSLLLTEFCTSSFRPLLSDPLNWILLIPFIVIELLLLFGILLLLSVPFAVFLKYHLLSFLEAWFVGADIPFFDAPAPGPETDLSGSELNV